MKQFLKVFTLIGKNIILRIENHLDSVTFKKKAINRNIFEIIPKVTSGLRQKPLLTNQYPCLNKLFSKGYIAVRKMHANEL